MATITQNQVANSYSFDIKYQDDLAQPLKVVVEDSGTTEVYNNDELITDTTYNIPTTYSGVYTVYYFLWNGTDWVLDDDQSITVLQYKIGALWLYEVGDNYQIDPNETHVYTPSYLELNNNACPTPAFYSPEITYSLYDLINEQWVLRSDSTTTISLSGWDDQDPDLSSIEYEYTTIGYPLKIVTTITNCGDIKTNDTYINQGFLITSIDAVNTHSEIQGISSYDVTFNYKYGNQDGDYPQLIITPENSSYTTCTLYLYKNNVLIHSYPNLTPSVYYPYSFAEASKTGVVYKAAYVSTNGTYTFTQEVPFTVKEYKPEFTIPTIQCKKINENATIALDGLRFNCFANDRDLHPENPDFIPAINYKLYYLNPNTYTWEPKDNVEEYNGVNVPVESAVEDYLDQNPNANDSTIGNYLEDEFAYGKNAVELWTPNKLTMVKMVVTVTNYSTSVMKETIFPICGTWKIRRMACGNYRIYNYTENEINFFIEKSNNGSFSSFTNVTVGALTFENLNLDNDGIYKVSGSQLVKYIFNFCAVENCILELQKKVLLDDELCDACKLDKVLYQKALRLIPIYETWKKLLDRDWVYEIQYQSTDVAGSLAAIYDADELYLELKDLCDSCDYKSEKCNCK